MKFGFPSGSVRSPAFQLLLALVLLAAVPLREADSVPRSPLPPWPENSLNAWRFNDSRWLTNPATQPLIFDASVVSGWSGYALRMAGDGPAFLAIPEVSLSGKNNLAPNGPATIRFWFAPDWASARAGGNGPGEEVRLLETGAWSSKDAWAHGALTVEEDGGALRLDVGGQTICRAAIQWSTGEWHQLALAVSGAGHGVVSRWPNRRDGIERRAATLGCDGPHQEFCFWQRPAGRTAGASEF